MTGEKQVSSVPSSDIAVITSMSLVVRTSVWDREPRLRVSLSPAHGHEGGASLVPHLLGRRVPCRDVWVLPGAGGTGQHIEYS